MTIVASLELAEDPRDMLSFTWMGNPAQHLKDDDARNAKFGVRPLDYPVQELSGK